MRKSGRPTNYELYIIFLVPLLYLLLFRYYPMYGAQIAFRKFSGGLGLIGSPWVGLANFRKFFESYQFWRVLKNTLGLSFYSLAMGFPFPIILALLIHTSLQTRLKKITQMVTIAPHFISTVVVVGMVIQFLSPRLGIINKIIELFGIEAISFMGRPEYFKSIFVFSNIWQHTGWGTIIYLAALAAIDPNLHEAALVDGASRLRRIWHIDIPGILPTAVVLLIINTGRIMNVAFEKVYLMQNDLNLSSSEIIQTYVYKIGIAAQLPNYSYSTAIGLFNSVIGLILVLIVNAISKRITETSLW